MQPYTDDNSRAWPAKDHGPTNDGAAWLACLATCLSRWASSSARIAFPATEPHPMQVVANGVADSPGSEAKQGKASEFQNSLGDTSAGVSTKILLDSSCCIRSLHQVIYGKKFARVIRFSRGKVCTEKCLPCKCKDSMMRLSMHRSVQMASVAVRHASYGGCHRMINASGKIKVPGKGRKKTRRLADLSRRLHPNACIA